MVIRPSYTFLAISKAALASKERRFLEALDVTAHGVGTVAFTPHKDRE
jgi:hypothetical protein